MPFGDGAPPVSICSGAPAPAAVFDTFKIGDAAATGAHPVVTFAPDGAPLVVYVVGDPGQERIVAARLDAAGDGGAPQIQVTALSALVPTATPPAVAATREGIAVAYVANVDETYYARYITWTGRVDAAPVDVAPTADASGRSTPALTVDENDRPVMTMLYPDFSLRLLAPSANGVWSRETVALAVLPTESTRIEIALDASGRPTLAGTNTQVNPYGLTSPLMPSIDGITVWRQTDAGWTTDRLLVDLVGLAPRLRLSPSGETTMFYFSIYGFGRAVLAGDDWRFDDPVVDTSGHTVFGGMPDVAFGPQGGLRIASLAEHGMTYAAFDGCTWSQTVIDGASDGPSIAVDGAGRSHIVYERPGAAVDQTGAVTNEVWYARSRS